ncbi:O-antigen acetylase [Stenotrophomonas sp. Betaine-02u-21]|uniref:acyltransferase family protein n=1 Tax=unclassified Stenotrophomonas TaxID=196198 RepID=UPI000C325A62|nr:MULTISPECIES: acyltransferase family protein [unclassified Stenotrophomonas]PKH70109.1 O-antigen acetylase [Stenotrophomonas sp. Betaine-02u-23]PKH74330.1 O-antigen acetylase [Stenotrophomonas sp. Betaine-02u-21]PKH96539.1 O-antigen acetylase [Stenotrophomonas sp. Bg11-02]
MSANKYRPDIDGLRSLAIAPVVLYHAGVPAFTGGFVGVDVFFVISGYLITSILAREISEGRYSLASFYERRIRRIFPALLLVIAFTLAAAPLFLLPSEFINLGRDAIASLLFVANINFWLQTGYFAADAESRPLLHMWSLGVEEQFYVFAPLLLYVIFRYIPKLKFAAVGFAFIFSLAACVYFTPSMPGASFYLLPTRAWELLAGSMLALQAFDQRKMSSSERSVLAPNILGCLGLVLVVAPVFLYSKMTVFPGVAAIAPVVGAALLIYSGESSSVGRLLSVRPMVGLGLISFSLYLWHWPLVVIFRNAGWLDDSIGKGVVIALSLALAWLTTKYVEAPTRNRERFTPRGLASAVGGVAVVLVGLSIFYSSLNGCPARFSSEVVAYDKARNDRSPDRERCHFDPGLPSLDQACVLGAGDATLAVWGDSHGVELAKAISEAGYSVQELTYSSCPPALYRPSPPSRPYCQQHNNRVFNRIVSSKQLRSVVLVAYYSSRETALPEQVSMTAARLRQAGKHVVIVRPYPLLDGHSDVPSYLARGGAPWVKDHAPADEAFRKTMAEHAEVVMPRGIFCAMGRCNLIVDGHPIFFDAHHPSMHAARLLAVPVGQALSLRGSLPSSGARRSRVAL